MGLVIDDYPKESRISCHEITRGFGAASSQPPS